MSTPLIVALGASAGGIQALKEFFEHTSHNAGVSYVVLLHLSPNHDSQLAQVLQQATKMPVTQVTEKTHIEPNHVYVIPPDKHLTMEDGHIIPSANLLMEERRAPVDIFFRSLAETHGGRAVGVILSGTGANGSMGLKRIKEKGGAVFAQNPREAEFNEMPRNAIATDLVDDVLNVAEIPGRILVYRDTLGETHIPEEPENRVEEEQHALREIFTQLRLRTGHDFSNYKRATLMRRIERRMAIRAFSALPDYAVFSNEHPEETQALLKDLLISVTNFFRDKTPFAALEEEILPAIFENKTAEEQVRIWVAGCATGEEAYTIAMLCAERTLGHVDAPKVQIFATDIDEAAISTAREGLYSLNDAADVSAECLARFFTKEGDCYRVRREIRETILFAHHNFLKDPPFSRIDLVSCRNVLIYLNRPAQERVMETFHFAMKQNGFMLLGTSESVDMASDLFKSYNREQHIYQSRIVANLRSIVVPETVPQLRVNQPAIQPANEHTRPASRMNFGDLHVEMVEQYAPPSLAVNAEFNIVHMSPRAGRYLMMTGGEPTQAVLKLIRDELRAEVRNSLYQAVQKGTPVNSTVLRVRTEGGTEDIRIHVRPLMSENEEKRGYLLIVFEPAAGAELHQEIIASTSDESVTRHLEDELTRLRAQLRVINEQHEFQAEELKAGNEELQAMNEELRSATEELETSKEELQSINEELSTVNQELKVKVEEATMVSNNLQNLINSTDIGTIFLDRSFRVVLFTPAVRSVFSLIPSDYGRPLADIKGKLQEDTLLEDAARVLDRLQMIEREAQSTDGRTFIIRLAPYRTEDDRIQGVVISMVDITESKRASEIIRTSEARLQRMVNVPRVGVLTFDYSGKLLHANDAFLKMTGYDDREEFEKRVFTWRDFTPPEYVADSEEVMRQLLEKEQSEPYEKEYFRKDGSRIWMMFVAANIGDGTIVEYALDISDRRAAEQALRESEARLEAIFNVAPAGLALADASGKILRFNDALNKIWGMPPVPDSTADYAEWKARWADTGEPLSADDWAMARTLRTGEVVTGDLVDIERFDGGHATILNAAAPIRDATGSIIGGVVAEIDVTAQRQAEQALRKSEAAIRTISDAAPAFVWVCNNAGENVFFNRRWYEFSGQTEEDAAGYGWTTAMHPEDAERILPYWQHCQETGDVYEGEVRYRRADGTYRWHQFRALPRRDANDVIEAWYGLSVDVHEAKLTGEALQQSEERFRLFVTAASNILYRMSPDWSEMYALEGKGFLADTPAPSGAWLSAYIPDSDKAMVQAAIADAIRERKMFELEHRVVRADGSIGWTFSRAVPFLNEQGEIKEWFGAASDITERREISEALSASEERLQLAASVSGFGIHDFDIAASTIYWSPELKAMHGIPSDTKLSFETVLSAIHPDDRERAEREMRGAMALDSNGEFEQEFRIIRRDNGETRWVYNRSRTIFEGEGAGRKPVRNTGIAIDITERQLAEERIRLSEERYRVALKSAEMGAWDWNVAVDEVVWNEQHFQMLGTPIRHEKLAAEDFIRFIHPDDLTYVSERLRRAVEETGLYEAEFRIVREDNAEVRWMVGFGRSTSRDEAGKSTRMVGVMYDITARKRLEEQKEDFIGAASHELKTPLTSIKVYSEVLRDMFTESGDEQSAKLMGKLDSQIDRLTKLIRALLDVTRIREGKLELQKERFELMNLFTEVIEELQRTTPIKLKMPDIPSIIVLADRNGIMQVIINLLSNAIKYSRGTEEIDLSIRTEMDEVIVCVRDYGIGMSAEVTKKVFDRFYRAQEAGADTYPGLGIGLYISAEIVRLHSGRIWAESEVAKGSTFCFSLPIGIKA